MLQPMQRLTTRARRRGQLTVTRDAAAGARLAAEIVDEIGQIFRDAGARCDFRKGREFRVRQPEIMPGHLITGRLIAPAIARGGSGETAGGRNVKVRTA